METYWREKEEEKVMKGFQYTFHEGLAKGLRKYSSNMRNVQSLVECHNAMPMEDGLHPHEDVIALCANSIDWGGGGVLTGYSPTRSITISIEDYVSEDDLEGASVYIDGVLKGTTDASGELNIADISVGTHNVKITKIGYVDSDDDELLNDYLVIT